MMSDDKKTTPPNTNRPLVVIVGPTASGKSAVAMEIAKKYGGEIICADSRTIYKGMDIGTAKPTPQDQEEVPHWGLDLVEPGDRFTAADFKEYAVHKIAEIRSRGGLPMLVGGTGLYVDGIVFDFQFGAPDPVLRESLEAMTLEELHEYCKSHNVQLPENKKNKRYVIRAIEQNGTNQKREQQPLENTIIVGITTDSVTLRSRITGRAAEMFETGVIDEALRLGDRYGWESEAMTGNVYPLVRQYIEGHLTEGELKEKFVTADWRLAKRQRTWLKRNPYIVWEEKDQATAYISEMLTPVDN